MPNKDLPKLNLAIQEKRYRDAREIIEKGDLDPKTAAKWRQWLSELHHEDREQVGIASDKAKLTPTVQQSPSEIVGRLVPMAVAALILYWVVDFAVFASYVNNFCFLLVVLWIFGAWGWGKLMLIVNGKYGRILGVVIALAMPVLVIGFYDPPGSMTQSSMAQLRLAIFLIALPGVEMFIWERSGGNKGSIRGLLDYFEPPLNI